MNFSVNIKICRVCMKTEEGASLSSDKATKDKFVFTTQLAISSDDGMPTILCRKCVNLLNISYEFVHLAQDTERKLKSFLNKISNDFESVTNFNSGSTPPANFNLEEDLALALDSNHSDLAAELLSDNETKSSKARKKGDELIETIKDTEKYTINKKEDASSAIVLASTTGVVSEEYGEFEEVNSVIDRTDGDIEKINDINKLKPQPLDIDDNISNDRTLEPDEEVGDIKIQFSEETECTEERLIRRDDYVKDYEAIIEDDGFVMDPTGEENDNAMHELHLYDSNDELLQDTEVDESITNEMLNEVDSIGIDEENSNSTQHLEINAADIAETENMKKFRKLRKARNFQKKYIDEILSKNSKCSTKTMQTRFYCEKCNRDFSTKTNLNRHMGTHNGVKPFKCFECKKRFTQNTSLKQHMLIHTGEKPYVCEVCHRGFSQSKSLVFHMRRHTGDKPFRCESCQADFRQKDGLKAHLLKHHICTATAGDKKVHICILCEIQFTDKRQLQKHMNKHVNNYESQHNAKRMLDYINDEQVLSDKVFVSEELVENINSATHVVDILATSTSKPNRAKKFQCRVCFKCFALKESLIRHLNVHGYKISEELKCQVCKLSFKTSQDIKFHRVDVHNEVGVNITECDECEVVFLDMKQLEAHISKEHIHSCKLCPDTHYKTEKLLLEHMLEHELNDMDTTASP